MRNDRATNNEWIQKAFFTLRKTAAENETITELPKELKRLLRIAIRRNGNTDLDYVYNILTETVVCASLNYPGIEFSDIWTKGLRMKILKTNASIPTRNTEEPVK